jgi:hypothetical protein
MEVKTTEFFKNIKDLPPPDSSEFRQLIDWEIEKCMGGVTVNGVHFSGWLYCHLNHWYIRIDKKDNYGNIVRIKSLPFLRDNEWIRSEALEKCKIQRKGYMEVGLRQGGKSEFEASVTGWSATFFELTQNVIVGGNGPDLSLLTDKLDFGINNMWEGIRIPRIDKDWKKPLVRLGFKERNNEDQVWSYLVIRNAQEGNNTEAPAGTTAKSFVIDEVGKFPFGQVFEAAKPAFLSEHGWRTIPILVGTGGSFENGADAERFFYNPDSNNFLSFLDPETGKYTCLFMSGLYRQDCKYITTLSDWLIKEGSLVQGVYPELEKIEIRVADKELAAAKIKEEREVKAKDPDRTEYLKAIMYHPLTPDECFLSSSDNIYNIRAAKAQQQKLYDLGRTGTPVILFHGEEGKVKHVFTDKMPISSFPLKNNESKDAPVVIYEFPIDNPPFGLYVAGVDPYRQGKAEYSDSLGAVYIYKRMHDINSELYQDMFVASYVARPDNKDDWEEQARLLVKYYNARTLCENDDISFIEYMKAKGDAHYLEPQPAWLKELVQNSTVKREYGIHRSSDRIRDHLHTSLKRYLETVLYREVDEVTGSVNKEILGVNRVLDPMLLEEIIKFNPDINCDREVAASLAIALAYHLDPIIGKVGENNDPRFKAIFDKKRRAKTSNKLFDKVERKIKTKGRNRNKLFT